MAYTVEKIESISKKLSEMPPVDNKNKQVSKQEAVKMLAKEIRSLQDRGYNLDQIAESLRGEGLEITTPTLKSYLQRTKQTKSKKAKQNKKTTEQIKKKDENKEEIKDKNQEVEKKQSPEKVVNLEKSQRRDSKKGTHNPREDSDKI